MREQEGERDIDLLEIPSQKINTIPMTSRYSPSIFRRYLGTDKRQKPDLESLFYFRPFIFGSNIFEINCDFKAFISIITV